MKVGSKVMYCPVREYEEAQAKLFFDLGYIVPKKNTPYTVIEISKNGDGVYILLDEIRNPDAGRGESGYNALFFREIFPSNDKASETTYEDIMTEIEEQELQTA